MKADKPEEQAARRYASAISGEAGIWYGVAHPVCQNFLVGVKWGRDNPDPKMLSRFLSSAGPFLESEIEELVREFLKSEAK